MYSPMPASTAPDAVLPTVEVGVESPGSASGGVVGTVSDAAVGTRSATQTSATRKARENTPPAPSGVLFGGSAGRPLSRTTPRPLPSVLDQRASTTRARKPALGERT